MLTLQHITYIHPDRELLFSDLDLQLQANDKVALVGNNGAGKSTLLRIMAGVLMPSGGTVQSHSTPYYIPQLFGQFNHLTVGEALRVEDKLKALHAILEGDVSNNNLALLNDDWTIEERSQAALLHWGLHDIPLTTSMENLSGGQKTKVFLAGISIHQPDIVLFDEPSNHLDRAGRELLYELVQTSTAAIMIVSHDRTLLNLLDPVYELSKRGITVYGGNYDFYATQKKLENEALHQDLKNKVKALRKAKETARETMERQQKLDARGKKKKEKEGLPTISMNTFRNNAEKSTARIKGIHAEKTDMISQELQELRAAMPGVDTMKFGFDHSGLHKGKMLITAKDINYSYNDHLLWAQPLSFQINSGERIALAGLNGSGKTTLIKMMLGALEPSAGIIQRAAARSVYIDQDYSLIDNRLTVYEQAQRFNQTALQEHEIRIRLTRFLFTKDHLDKPCSTLSGGEKMRLMLCCLTIGNEVPDIIILDEPTNNLDIQNIDILTAAINEYQGTLIVVSHDARFLEEVGVGNFIYL